MHFWAQAKFDAQVLGEGKGLSKKEAEQNAAEDAYTKMVKK
jgi:dsRNA-specific ribonuclease